MPKTVSTIRLSRGVLIPGSRAWWLHAGLSVSWGEEARGAKICVGGTLAWSICYARNMRPGRFNVADRARDCIFPALGFSGEIEDKVPIYNTYRRVIAPCAEKPILIT